jgi:hypothetical protein
MDAPSGRNDDPAERNRAPAANGGVLLERKTAVFEPISVPKAQKHALSAGGGSCRALVELVCDP